MNVFRENMKKEHKTEKWLVQRRYQFTFYENDSTLELLFTIVVQYWYKVSTSTSTGYETMP